MKDVKGEIFGIRFKERVSGDDHIAFVLHTHYSDGHCVDWDQFSTGWLDDLIETATAAKSMLERRAEYDPDTGGYKFKKMSTKGMHIDIRRLMRRVHNRFPPACGCRHNITLNTEREELDLTLMLPDPKDTSFNSIPIHLDPGDLDDEDDLLNEIEKELHAHGFL